MEASAISHVNSRGNNRQPIFIDDVDYSSFLRMLAEVVVSSGWKCHAYCLMPNHFHLLLEHPESALGVGMNRLKGRYSRRFNARHGRIGHLFERRYYAEPVRADEHFAAAARYIVLNPIRAGLCDAPGDWPWSSYAATVGEVTGSFVETETLWELCHGADGFRRFVADGVEQTASSLKAAC